MTEPTTNPGLSFTIKNNCSNAVKGFAVGDELYLLEIGTATFLRPVFQGDLGAGEEVQVMTGAGPDGNGDVLFIPSVGCATEAVRMTVSPNETVNIPSNFCGCSGPSSHQQFSTSSS